MVHLLLLALWQENPVSQCRLNDPHIFLPGDRATKAQSVVVIGGNHVKAGTMGESWQWTLLRTIWPLCQYF